ncbi:ABC transporter-like protein [Desulfovibrio sp. X2]|uniref:ABC transporter-like protein n=1 Tax=Desulfovibrio sp. X2 TaxID=941449 RepID=UPI000358B880|nr:ABC transporter-like protein [Desulfovibrio sp. X2]EPR43477.1 ABC transporter-like protein [Desulfovibrio sp. X2]
MNVLTRVAACAAALSVVTHEMGLAREAADSVAFMDQGEILEQDRPDRLFAAPRQARTRRFLGRIL